MHGLVRSSVKEESKVVDEPESNLIASSQDQVHVPEYQEQRAQARDLANEEAFCIAWFAPEGISVLAIPEDEDYQTSTIRQQRSDIGTKTNVAHFMAATTTTTERRSKVDSSPPANNERQQCSDDDKASAVQKAQLVDVGKSKYSPDSTTISMRKTKDDTNADCPKQQSATATTSSKKMWLAEEWRGYHSCHQVLRHFGYTQFFLNELLLQALSLSDSQEKWLSSSSSFGTNLVVRGATVARPEGYCFCHAKQDDVETNVNTKSNARSKRRSNNHNNNTNNYMQPPTTRKHQRDVLPRVIHHVAASKPPLSIQFLNATGDHALCMMTPPLACGPVAEPITIFCVGIATEDGCFLSGLHSRFELAHGHLYPGDEDDHNIDGLDASSSSSSSSLEIFPVCIATERWEPRSSDADNNCDQQQQQRRRMLQTRMSSSFNSGQRIAVPPPTTLLRREESSSMGSCDTGLSSDSSCECIFRESGTKDLEGDRDPDLVVEGLLGPGAWHCYVAIFDGVNSRIRIDGVEEPVQLHTRSLPASLDWADDRQHQQQNAAAAAATTNTQNHSSAMLDGLTLGSDHCFGLSLCNGQGGDDYFGQGAIAEVAAFHGSMPELDIQCLERKLMVKHCIPTPAPDFRRHNVMERQAHRLFASTPIVSGGTERKSRGSAGEQRDSGKGTRVPLRYMARNSTVAWEQVDPITGGQRRIGKIGAKDRGDSTDW
ncbi:hypothetical protein ACA910_004363 [Epithemia clementina (nom. ined.)]